MSDIVDLTEGPFDVKLASDGGGNHIEIQIEKHEDSGKIRDFLNKNYSQRRIIILLVPSGYLD